MKRFNEILADLWKGLLQGNKVEICLKAEIDVYHKYAKHPDTSLQVARFYAAFEPILDQAACNSKEQYKAWQTPKSDINYESIRNKEILIVVKGTIKLAHTIALRGLLKTKTEDQARRYCIIAMDYNESKREFLEHYYGVETICIGDVSSMLKYRYFMVARIISDFQCNGRMKARKADVIWWGIPFGICFVGALLRYLGNDALDLGYATLKHHFTFGEPCIRRYYTYTPIIKGFANKSVTTILSPMYMEDDLLPKEMISKRDKETISLIRSLKKMGMCVVSSISRSEKLMGVKFLRAVSTMLEQNKSIVYLYCTKDKENDDGLNYLYKHGRRQHIIPIGWIDDCNRVIQELDIFLDPFPFGAGMMLASAINSSIPSVVLWGEFEESPSLRTVIRSRLNESQLKTSCNTTEDYVASVLECCRNHEARRALIARNKEILEQANIISRS